MSVPLRLYRLLLKLYPASFREPTDRPLERQFKDEYAEVQALRAGCNSGCARWWISRAPCRSNSCARSVKTCGTRFGTGGQSQSIPRSPSSCWPSPSVPTPGSSASWTLCSSGRCRFMRPNGWRRCGCSPSGTDIESSAFHKWRQENAYLADAVSFTSVEVNLDGVGRVRSHATDGNLVERSSRCSAFSRLSVVALRPTTRRTGPCLGRDHQSRILAAAVWPRHPSHRFIGSHQRRPSDNHRCCPSRVRLPDHDGKSGRRPCGTFLVFPRPASRFAWSSAACAPSSRGGRRERHSRSRYRVGRRQGGWRWANHRGSRRSASRLAGPLRQASFVLMAGVSPPAASSPAPTSPTCCWRGPWHARRS